MTVHVEDPDVTSKQIVERLVGATGDPHKIVEAARNMAIRAMPGLSEAFSEATSASLLIDLSDVEVVRLAELKPEVDSHEVLVVVPADVSRDALTMRLDPPALSLLVNGFFGGDPDIPSSPIDRLPTPIEMDVASVVFDLFAKALNGTGQRSLGLRLPVPNLLSGPRAFKRMFVRDGPGVRITFALTLGDETGTLTAWMPQRVLMETRAPTTDPTVERADAKAWKQRFNSEVLRSTVKMNATIPLRKMPLRELSELREGQVLDLLDGARSEARLSVRGRTVFTGEFGKLGQNYTVRIKDPFDARQDVINGLLGEHANRTTGDSNE